MRIAINGFGRIGRNVLRALYESHKLSDANQNIKIVAINDLGDAKVNSHLLKYDSIHGHFNGAVALKSEGDQHSLVIDNDTIALTQIANPKDLPWQALKVDIVLECTGLFTEYTKAKGHLEAGAKKVIVSAPGKDMDATIVYGVNHANLTGQEKIISNASCTTNCLAPVASILHKAIGIEQGQMTTIHSYTNDQHVTDAYHSDIYRARAAALSMIPTKTGAAAAVGLVLPELAGRLDGMAVRVPTANVSLVDLTFIASRSTSVEEINQAVKQAATSNTELSKVLQYVDEPLVSIDFNHSAFSSCFDSQQTRVDKKLVKVMAWYDNEWGFSNRMLDTAQALFKAH